MTSSLPRPRVGGSALSKCSCEADCSTPPGTPSRSPKRASRNSGDRRQCFYAPFKPGDRVIVDYEDDGAMRQQRHYLIVDVCPDRKAGYHYEVAELTKNGTMHKRRWPYSLSPRSSLTLRLSDLPLSDDAEWAAKYYQECARTARVLAFEKGDLSLFEPVEGMLGSRHLGGRIECLSDVTRCT